jgi:hypothetical protein
LNRSIVELEKIRSVKHWLIVVDIAVSTWRYMNRFVTTADLREVLNNCLN